MALSVNLSTEGSQCGSNENAIVDGDLISFQKKSKTISNAIVDHDHRDVNSKIDAMIDCNTDANTIENGFNKSTIITLDNVHKCSTYALRQELERRGVTFPGSHGQIINSNTKTVFHSQNIDCGEGIVINHDALLQKMIQLLYHEQETQGQNSVNKESNSSEENERESLKKRLEREKMERKKEAIKRSNQRQREEGYFIKKKIANEEGLKFVSASALKASELVSTSDGQPVCGGTDDESGQEDDLLKTDRIRHPFAAKEKEDPFALRFRPKIGGRSI